MGAFYELMDRDRLVGEAAAIGFPRALLTPALAVYGGPRLLMMHGRTARELYPRKGIVAGCSLATTLVKVYYAKAFDELRARLPRAMSFDVHIDDIIMTMVGRPEEVVESLAAAHEELRRTITLVLKGRVAEAKTNAVGSTREVATGLCRRLGIEGKV